MSEINVETLSVELQVGALALGSFDGVHLGHSELLKATVQESEALGLEPAVLTFSPHPRAFFSSRGHKRIYSFQQNLELIESDGILKIFVKKFDRACSELSAEGFLDLIWLKLKFKILIVGFDFKLGKNREGSQNDLREWCRVKNIKLKIIVSKNFKNEKISSSRIKKNLEKGSVEEVSLLLGRDYFHKGEVVRDQGLGKQIGFPTLNLKLDPQMSILPGAYVTTVVFLGKEYPAVSNIGFRPTVSSDHDKLVLESHVLVKNFPACDAGAEIKVFFKKFLRTEQNFSNIQELKDQIKTDVASARSYFN